MQRRTPLWLSHHYPDDYDRCATVAGRHVCRRCLWFYPACFAVTVASLSGLHWPASIDAWMLWLLPVPVVAEWWGEHLGRIEYRPGRSVLFSLLAAPAVGRGLGRYLLDQSDTLFWSVVAAYAVICAIPMVLLNRPRQHSRGPRGRPATDGGARPAP
ncbi:MAG: hypothetical protein IT195_10900 [Microthrixaceae bacterium]|nr:hypothetical protein [Microthrixaceae bacterium]